MNVLEASSAVETALTVPVGFGVRRPVIPIRAPIRGPYGPIIGRVVPAAASPL